MVHVFPRPSLQDLIGHYDFKSKTPQDKICPDGSCRAAMFALFVNEELKSWPEQDIRQRTWVTIPEAVECCRHPWMRDALVNGFLKWQGHNMLED
ncbi:hypothetical protein MLD38_038221 [Melastoma candidum]|uniref:Uncharacterized protein n=1 Tax=Melastoma candidum TaxID=119954 RepID=A0ACB9KZD9_9MYRT|nr:hypothetical protein MLD38_038221 [Melastoma candidum]